jgi:hypothetical protein
MESSAQVRQGQQYTRTYQVAVWTSLPPSFCKKLTNYLERAFSSRPLIKISFLIVHQNTVKTFKGDLHRLRRSLKLIHKNYELHILIPNPSEIIEGKSAPECFTMLSDFMWVNFFPYPVYHQVFVCSYFLPPKLTSKALNHLLACNKGLKNAISDFPLRENVDPHLYFVDITTPLTDRDKDGNLRGDPDLFERGDPMALNSLGFDYLAAGIVNHVLSKAIA